MQANAVSVALTWNDRETSCNLNLAFMSWAEVLSKKYIRFTVQYIICNRIYRQRTTCTYLVIFLMRAFTSAISGRSLGFSAQQCFMRRRSSCGHSSADTSGRKGGTTPILTRSRISGHQKTTLLFKGKLGSPQNILSKNSRRECILRN